MKNTTGATNHSYELMKAKYRRSYTMSGAVNSSGVPKKDDPIPAKRKKLNDDPDICLSACRFRDVLCSESFVDKSMMIKDVLATQDSLLVTAPRKFGKSVNADMLKTFLEIEVDQFGNRLTHANSTEAVIDTDNYRLFTSDIPKLPGQKLNISKEYDLLHDYLGKYPVLYVNFRCGQISCFEDVIECCKGAVRDTYLQHQYLCFSSRLDPAEQAYCKKWCNISEHKLFSKSSVESSLKELSRLLYKHFDHRCFVIVDEYDSICSSSMYSNFREKPLTRIISFLMSVLGMDKNPYVKKPLEDIISFFLTILDLVLKQNEHFVEKGFITGISYMCTTGLSKINNIIAHKFLQNKKFSSYYGLTVNECEDLMERFSVSVNTEDIFAYYNGYSFGKTKILSIWSIMNYLKQKKLSNYWKDSGTVTGLDELMKIDVIKFSLLEMVADMSKLLKVVEVDKITVNMLCNLREMIRNPEVHVDPDLYFCFLLEQGYFSVSRTCNDESDRNILFLSIPNREIRTVFDAKLRTFYKSKAINLDFELVNRCTHYWNRIDFSDRNNIKENLKSICEVLNAIFEKLKIETKNEATFHHVMLVALLDTKFKCSSEALCSKYLNKGKLDILLVFDDCYVIIELKYNKTCHHALNDIIERKYCDIFEQNEKLSVKHYVLIGANMNSEKNITMCALIDNKNVDDMILL